MLLLFPSLSSEIINLIQAVLLAAVNSGNRKTWQILLPTFWFGSNIVDGLGNPVEFTLSAGNDHDSVHAVELLEKVEIGGSNVLADRAYGAKARMCLPV